MLLGAVFLVLNSRSSKNETPTTNQIDINDPVLIDEVKKEIDATGDTDIYQIYEEYDGRKILQIKPEVQYNTALAGIIKNDIPQEDEVSKLLEKAPTKKGIWISEASRENFLKLLKANNINQYEIDEDGYLYSTQNSEDENYKKIEKAINSEKLYIIDCFGRSYVRDEMTGEIYEYQFEAMDYFQAVDVYEKENSKIIEITTNKNGKLTEQEILTDILLNFE